MNTTLEVWVDLDGLPTLNATEIQRFRQAFEGGRAVLSSGKPVT